MTDEVTIPTGMKPWAGGDAAPTDWDGGPVLFRKFDGWRDPVIGRWKHDETASATDIIAYTPMTPEPAQPAESPEAREYRKTATIRASQWWKMGDHPAVREYTDIDGTGEMRPWVDTLEGGHIVTPGDWIATGVQGEHWPIKADVFAVTYEAVGSIARHADGPSFMSDRTWPECLDPNAAHNRRATAAIIARPTERWAAERVARKLCEQHGGDPDATATDEHDMWDGPLWTAFVADAHTILALTPPVTVAATDSRITKDWCLNMARLEDGQEIGAGMPDHPLRAPEVAATDQAGEALARRFHETYERLAPLFGYETRTETREFDPSTPNGKLMIAVCAALAAQPATGRTMGGEDGLRAALEDIETMLTPAGNVWLGTEPKWQTDAYARARTALQNGGE